MMTPTVIQSKPSIGGTRLSHDNSAYPAQDWDQNRWSIQSWFERTAWKGLKDTYYGVEKSCPEPNQRLWADPLMFQIYLLDIASFITAERTSMLAVSGMVRCAPDESSQVHLSTQVFDEARHYEVFCRRMADFGITPDQRADLEKQVLTPAMRKFYDLIHEQVDKGDFVGSSLAQNITMEGMAYPIYRYEIKYWSKIDPGLSQIIRGAFADEAHHVGFGEAIMKSQLKKMGTENRNRAKRLLSEFQMLMGEVFEGVIHQYIGLYQQAANNHMDLMGDIEIFPGHRMKDVTEEQQVRILLSEIHDEQGKLLGRIGL
jgi:Long-chain fatty aldehyde decarbonylase